MLRVIPIEPVDPASLDWAGSCKEDETTEGLERDTTRNLGGFLWYSYRIRIGCVKDLYGMSIGFVQDVRRKPIGSQG